MFEKKGSLHGTMNDRFMKRLLGGVRAVSSHHQVVADEFAVFLLGFAGDEGGEGVVHLPEHEGPLLPVKAAAVPAGRVVGAHFVHHALLHAAHGVLGRLRASRLHNAAHGNVPAMQRVKQNHKGRTGRNSQAQTRHNVT